MNLSGFNPLVVIDGVTAHVRDSLDRARSKEVKAVGRGSGFVTAARLVEFKTVQLADLEQLRLHVGTLLTAAKAAQATLAASPGAQDPDTANGHALAALERVLGPAPAQALADGHSDVQWRWVDERGRAMTNWKAGPTIPPMASVSDEKGTMRVEIRKTPETEQAS